MPGPLPAYGPDFSTTFVVQGQQLVTRRTVKYQLRQRARLVLLLHAQPHLSHVEAATQVGLPPDSVRHWRQRWAKGALACTMSRDGGVIPISPPLDHALVKAVACELVAETEPPLSRQSLADLMVRAQRALGKPISRSPVGRILATDAIQPWRYQ